MSIYSLNVGVSWNSPWYFPGDTVKGTVYVECKLERHFDSKDGLMPLPQPSLHNYFSTSEYYEEETELQLHSLEFSVEALTALDIEKVNCESIQLPLFHLSKKKFKLYQLYQSPRYGIAEAVSLVSNQCRAFAFSFTLPTKTFPSIDTEFCKMYNVVNLFYRWSKGRSGEVVTCGSQSPLTIRSPYTSNIPFCLSSFSGETDRYFDNSTVAVFPVSSVPTAKLAPPTSEVFFSSEAQVFRPHGLWKAALEDISKEKSARKSRFEYGVKVASFLLCCVVVESTTVMIGENINVLLFRSHEKGDGSSDSVNLKSCVVELQRLHCISEDFCVVKKLRQVMSRHEYRIVSQQVLYSRTVSMSCLDSTSCSTCVNDKEGPTVLTDVAAVQYQLQLKFDYEVANEGASTEPLLLIVPLVVECPPKGSTSGVYHINFYYYQVIMLRRATARSASLMVLPMAVSTRNYNMFVFKNPDRRPQLTTEERNKVQVNYAEWPEEFRDYDPEDPYKNSPPIIENLTSWNLFLWGVEVAFIYQFYELVFYKSI